MTPEEEEENLPSDLELFLETIGSLFIGLFAPVLVVLIFLVQCWPLTALGLLAYALS